MSQMSDAGLVVAAVVMGIMGAAYIGIFLSLFIDPSKRDGRKQKRGDD